MASFEDVLQHPCVTTEPGALPTLAESLPLAPEEVAGIVAVVCRTVADLHRRGIVHGDLGVDAVVLDHGRPLVTRFHRSGPAGTIGPTGLLLDPSGDVADIGRLILRSLPLCGADSDDPWTTLRSRLAAEPVDGFGARLRRLLRRRGRASTADTLASLAALATAADPECRPTAAVLANEIQLRIPSARLPGATPGTAQVQHRRPGRRILLGGIALALLVSTGVALLTSRAQAPQVAPAGPPTLPAPASPPSGPVRVWPQQCEPVSEPQGDLDGDGCPEHLDYRGGVLTTRGARYAVGRDGDVVTAAAWHCDRRPMLALLRPDDGRIVLFEGWAEDGRDLAGRTVAMVPGAVSLVAGHGQDGCPVMVARRADGHEQRVVLRS